MKMWFVNKSWWADRPKKSRRVELIPNIDFSRALFVVDMQDGFIDPFLSSSLSSEAKAYCDKLKSNIIAKIEACLDQEHLVVIVEYSGNWKTIKWIQNLVKQASTKVITLQKRSDWVTHSANWKENLSETNLVLTWIKNRNASVEVVWINTGYCVLDSARWIRRKWIETTVPLWTTLNLHGSTFAKRNRLDWNTVWYWDDSDLLKFWGRSSNLKLLSDYL